MSSPYDETPESCSLRVFGFHQANEEVSKLKWQQPVCHVAVCCFDWIWSDWPAILQIITQGVQAPDCHWSRVRRCAGLFAWSFIHAIQISKPSLFVWDANKQLQGCHSGTEWAKGATCFWAGMFCRCHIKYWVFERRSGSTKQRLSSANINELERSAVNMLVSSLATLN